jgi:hypothetical protein
MELALKHRGDALRVVYALQIDDDIWVAHAFQKKSKSGILAGAGVPHRNAARPTELLFEAEARRREPHELLHLICIVERIRNALTNPEEPGRHYWHRHRGFPEVDGRPFALVPGWAHPAVSARVTTPNYRCRWRSKNRANSSNVSFVSGAV